MTLEARKIASTLIEETPAGMMPTVTLSCPSFAKLEKVCTVDVDVILVCIVVVNVVVNLFLVFVDVVPYPSTAPPVNGTPSELHVLVCHSFL